MCLAMSLTLIFVLNWSACHSGEVFVYSVLYSGADALLQTEFSHQMVIAKPGETPSNAASRTSSLAWSSDGYALVGGWDVGGLALWSTYGHLLFSTFSDESGFLSRYYLRAMSVVAVFVGLTMITVRSRKLGTTSFSGSRMLYVNITH